MRHLRLTVLILTLPSSYVCDAIRLGDAQGSSRGNAFGQGIQGEQAEPSDACGRAHDVLPAFRSCMARNFSNMVGKMYDTEYQGWAVDGFAVSHEHRVMYQFMPKSGSASIREVFAREYGYLDPANRRWKFPSMNTNRRTTVRIGNSSNTREFDGYFKFTFVRDPLEHLIAGARELHKDPRDALSLFRGTDPQDLHLVSDDPRGLTDGHMAPQGWLMRRVAERGFALDAAYHLDANGWQCLQSEMKQRGFKAPGDLPQTNALHTSSFDGIDADTLRSLCTVLEPEYTCLGYAQPEVCTQ